jgi:comEA protein
MRKLFAILFFCCTVSVFSQTEQGARPLAMGGAYIALADNVWAAFFNPAGLAQMNWREFSVFYSPQPFGVKELAQGSFAYLEPTNIGAIGLSGRVYGFELYREVGGAISYSNSYNGFVFYGATLRYTSIAIQNYGSTETIGIDVGVLAYLTNYLRWGFAATNVNAPTIGQAKERLPQTYSTGLSYNPAAELVLNFDVFKDVKYPIAIRFGAEYELLDMIALRAGIGNNPSTFSAGVGIRYSLFEFDYALSTHQDLGMTHQLSVAISFGGEGSRAERREKLRKELMEESVSKKKKSIKLKEGETVNINTAGVEELMKIPEVGESLAKGIIEYRELHGEFQNVEELKQVKGVSEARFERIKKYLRLKE